MNNTNTEALIYLGPTIYGVATSGTIYKDGILPNELKDAINDNPIIGALVVKISQANEARTELRRSGSSLSLFYKMIKGGK